MPLRPVNHDQTPTEGRESRWNRTWLLPPTLDDLLPQDHRPVSLPSLWMDWTAKLGREWRSTSTGIL